MKLQTIILSALLGAAAVAGPAQAELLDFTIVGDADIRFQLDSDAPPSFTIDDIVPIYNFYEGLFVNGRATFGTVMFPGIARSGGFGIGDNATFFYEAAGAQVYSGSGTAPRFAPGRWRFTDSFYGGANSVDFTLTIARAADAAVPEPSTWALMVIGTGLAGNALRRRRVRFAAA